MKNPLKFNSNKQRIWFGSDFHLSHLRDFIWKPRGFTSHLNHTQAVIERTNEFVEEDDVLFYLGDFSLNSNPEETQAFFDSIKCKNVFFIWGNHESSTRRIYDAAVAAYFKVPVGSFDVYPFRHGNVTFLGPSAYVQIDNQLVLLSHFAHLIWDNMQHGAWNLCGHSHGNCALINLDNVNGKILDVGVDNALKQGEGVPVFTYEQVWRVMQKKNVVVHDHHNSQTT